MKFGKTSGFDGLTKEHVTFSHPAMVLRMKFLFTMIYKHGFVPDDLVKAYVYLCSKTDLVTTLHWTIIDPLHSVLCCRKCLNIFSCINFFRTCIAVSFSLDLRKELDVAMLFLC